MSRFFLFFVLCFFSAVTQVLCAQSNKASGLQDTLAIVNNIPILSSEFEERYRFTPRIIPASDKSEKQARFEFLLALIAEKLLAEEAKSAGAEKSILVNNGYGSMEKLFFRDALWKDKMEGNIVIDDKEVLQEFIKLRSLVLVNFIYSADSTEIKNIYKKLQSGTAFDSLLKNRDEALMQDSSVIIEAGKGERAAEDLIFALKDSGSVTPPYKNNKGYFIFCLRFRGMKPLREGDDARLTALAKENVRSRKIDERYNEYYKTKLKGRKIQTDRMLFDRLADKLITALKKQADTLGEGKPVYLRKNDADEIKASFGKDTLELHFIYLDGRPVLFGELIDDLMVDGFFTAYPEMIPLQLQSRIKTMIEQELAFRDAKNGGYAANNSVIGDIATWKGYYLAQGMIEKLKDSVKAFVGGKEVKKGRLISVIELMTTDLSIVEQVLDSLRAGVSFSKLAAAYSSRHWGKQPGSPSPFLAPASFTGLTEALQTLKKGELGGPYKTGEYYSLIKIVDEKKNGVLHADSVSGSNAATAEYIMEKTAAAANKFNVKIFEKNVDKLTTKNSRSFIFRYIGFGGRIQAFPITPPFIEWYAKWKQQVPTP